VAKQSAVIERVARLMLERRESLAQLITFQRHRKE
jgi:hypothetical protein